MTQIQLPLLIILGIAVYIALGIAFAWVMRDSKLANLLDIDDLFDVESIGLSVAIWPFYIVCGIIILMAGAVALPFILFGTLCQWIGEKILYRN